MGSCGKMSVDVSWECGQWVTWIAACFTCNASVLLPCLYSQPPQGHTSTTQLLTLCLAGLQAPSPQDLFQHPQLGHLTDGCSWRFTSTSWNHPSNGELCNLRYLLTKMMIYHSHEKIEWIKSVETQQVTWNYWQQGGVLNWRWVVILTLSAFVPERQIYTACVQEWQLHTRDVWLYNTVMDVCVNMPGE